MRAPSSTTPGRRRTRLGAVSIDAVGIADGSS
jgi:hypothetical protein